MSNSELQRLLNTHRTLIDVHNLTPWWRFIKRRNIQQSINHYTSILLTALSVKMCED